MDSWGTIAIAGLGILLFIFLFGAVVGTLLVRILFSKLLNRCHFLLKALIILIVGILGGAIALELSAQIFGNQTIFFGQL